MKANTPTVLAVVLASLFFAILMPPEAYPVGKMVVVLSATLAFFAVIGDRRVSTTYLAAGIGVFGLLLVHSVWFSVDVYRSLEFLTTLWVYYCLLAFFIYAGKDLVPHVAGSVVILSIIVSGYGIYQYVWGFDQMTTEFLNAPVDGRVIDPALAIISNRRVFSTLALPGTLWGFLLTALPLQFVLWNRSRALNAALVTSTGLLLVTGLLTRSFGFIAGLFLLAIAWLLLYGKRGLWQKGVVAVSICAVAAGLFYLARASTFEQANPAELRFKNWVSAWNVFAVTPAGTGLNTFGVVYPQYHLPGANETQYAHNTPLQIMAELGYAGVLAGLAAILILAGRGPRTPIQGRLSYVLLALIAWSFHHAIDINFYFPSVGVLGVILTGLLLSRESSASSPSSDARQPLALNGAVATLAIACVVFSGIVLVSGELEHRAQIEIVNGEPAVALETLELAQKINPWNPALFQRSGDILLENYIRTKDRSLIEAAENSFRRATELSPMKFDAHLGLALSLSASDKTDAALDEIHIASRLYPANEYVRSVAKLMQNRVR